MSRKKREHKRKIATDPRYSDTVVGKLMNCVMKHGKKATAERVIYGAFEQIQKKLNDDPLKVFQKAMANIRPVVEVRARRVGGANYQVPTEVGSHRAQSLALRWLVLCANERTERHAAERFANEILDAMNNRGGAVKKREDTHRMADANKAFAHFKW